MNMANWLEVAASLGVAFGTGLLALVTWQMARNGKRQLDWLEDQESAQQVPRVLFDAAHVTMSPGGRGGLVAFDVSHFINLGTHSIVAVGAALGRGSEVLFSVPLATVIPSGEVFGGPTRSLRTHLTSAEIPLDVSKNIGGHVDWLDIAIRTGADARKLWRVRLLRIEPNDASWSFSGRNTAPFLAPPNDEWPNQQRQSAPLA